MSKLSNLLLIIFLIIVVVGCLFLYKQNEKYDRKSAQAYNYIEDIRIEERRVKDEILRAEKDKQEKIRIETQRAKTARQEAKTARQEAKKTRQMGETVNVGYTSYRVDSAWWKDTIDGDKPDAAFLLVKIWVRNNDKKERAIPPFYLIDENGSEYGTDNVWGIKDSFDTFHDLNPEVSTSGVIVFDVPKDHTYKLQVSGGYWSSEYALININSFKWNHGRDTTRKRY